MHLVVGGRPGVGLGEHHAVVQPIGDPARRPVHDPHVRGVRNPLNSLLSTAQVPRQRRGVILRIQQVARQTQLREAHEVQSLGPCLVEAPQEVEIGLNIPRRGEELPETDGRVEGHHAARRALTARTTRRVRWGGWANPSRRAT